MVLTQLGFDISKLTVIVVFPYHYGSYATEEKK